MISKLLAIDLIRDLYKSSEGLLPFTLYTRYKMSTVDLLSFIKEFEPRKLISIDEELRISLTKEGRRYAEALLNRHNDETIKNGSTYHKEVLMPQIGKYDPYIPDTSFVKKYKHREDGVTETSN